MTIHELARPPVLERHIASDYARDKVAAAFFETILDGLEYGPRDLPTPQDRDWIRGAIAIPIQEATDVALHDLARRLGRTLVRAPDRWLDRYEASHAGVEMGSE
jgi:hypothetical protein